MCLLKKRPKRVKKNLFGKNAHFIFYAPSPFCAYVERYTLSLKILAKRGGSMKDIFFSWKYKTLCFYKALAKHVSVSYEKRFSIPLINIRNITFWVPWHFLPMLVFCIFKKHLLSIMTPTLFARILRERITLKKKRRSKKYKMSPLLIEIWNFL